MLSLTSGISHSSAPSIITENVKVSRLPSKIIKPKVEPEEDMVLILDNECGLSDNDEMRGEEQEAAIKSPLKGKKQVNSDVSHSYLSRDAAISFVVNSNSLSRHLQRWAGLLQKSKVMNFQTGLTHSGFVTFLSQLIWPLLVKLWTLGTS